VRRILALADRFDQTIEHLAYCLRLLSKSSGAVCPKVLQAYAQLDECLQLTQRPLCDVEKLNKLRLMLAGNPSAMFAGMLYAALRI
jgi:hypothetical protein